MSAKRKTEHPPTAGEKVGGAIKELLIIVVGALIIAALIRAFVGQMFVIPSGSMENTLDINDKIAVQKITKFKRGDVVVFEDPGGWLGATKPDQRGPVGKALEFVGVLPNSSTEHLVKRVIGMPGDHVKCCDRKHRITVNGHPLDEHTYLFRAGGERNKPSDFPFDIVVPKDRIWVMGDHRADSADSRCHLNDTTSSGVKGEDAFVPVSDVVGPAFAIVAPFNRAKILSRPDTFSHVPHSKGKAPAKPKVLRHNVRC